MAVNEQAEPDWRLADEALIRNEIEHARKRGYLKRMKELQSELSWRQHYARYPKVASDRS